MNFLVDENMPRTIEAKIAAMGFAVIVTIAAINTDANYDLKYFMNTDYSFIHNFSMANAEITDVEDSRLVLLTVKASWSIKTDKTERPQVGSSEARLLKADNELQFQGELAAINSSSIGLVGFAIAETPLSLDLSPYKYIEFYARSQDPSIVYTLGLKDDQAYQDTGILAFDQEFVVGTDWTKLKLPLRNFRPLIRGKLVEGLELHLEKVRSLSLEIERSKQEASAPIPLNFALDIGSKVYVTNED